MIKIIFPNIDYELWLFSNLFFQTILYFFFNNVKKKETFFGQYNTTHILNIAAQNCVLPATALFALFFHIHRKCECFCFVCLSIPHYSFTFTANITIPHPIPLHYTFILLPLPRPTILMFCWAPASLVVLGCAVGYDCGRANSIASRRGGLVGDLLVRMKNTAPSIPSFSARISFTSTFAGAPFSTSHSFPQQIQPTKHKIHSFIRNKPPLSSFFSFLTLKWNIHIFFSTKYVFFP